MLQLTLAGGIVRSLEENGKVLINDRFLLGGALNMRGFERYGVGPHSDGDCHDFMQILLIKIIAIKLKFTICSTKKEQILNKNVGSRNI